MLHPSERETDRAVGKDKTQKTSVKRKSESARNSQTKATVELTRTRFALYCRPISLHGPLTRFAGRSPSRAPTFTRNELPDPKAPAESVVALP